MSHSPKTRTQKNKGGNSHSLERKLAALKNAEEREEMELNKPLKTFIKKKTKTRNQKQNPPENRHDRKSHSQDYPKRKTHQKQLN